MTYLSDLSQGRDNNLNVIRALAALAVLVSHAYPIALGTGAEQPLEALIGHTLGTMAVYAFFVISGFLIAMSYLRSRTKAKFIQARVLRLVPGLVVSLLVVGFVMGPFVTTLPTMTYLTHPETWTAVLRNATLIKLQFTLPGVFETQPYPTVQGSIWTLIYEVLCYVGVFLLGILGLLQKRVIGTAVLCVYIALWVVKEAIGITIHPRIDTLYELSVPFMLGTLIYLWQHKIPMSLLGVIAIIAACWLLRSTPLYDITLHIALAYTIFWLAYVPGGIIRAYNHLGDYSYGIYIYAFPAQGLAVWLYGPQSPLMNMAIALPLTVIPSILSWHYVEKPALDLRHRLGNRTQNDEAKKKRPI
jgi:peptidoglycan/LPS O-acetylase OafA/YrhL